MLGLLRLVGDLNRLYREEPSLHEQDFSYLGFEWIDFQDADSSVISFERYARDRRESIVVVCNFTPVPRTGYRVGVREPGTYREILNSDAAVYSGSNMGNGGSVEAEPVPLHYREYSIQLTLPPLGALFLKRS